MSCKGCVDRYYRCRVVVGVVVFVMQENVVISKFEENRPEKVPSRCQMSNAVALSMQWPVKECQDVPVQTYRFVCGDRCVDGLLMEEGSWKSRIAEKLQNYDRNFFGSGLAKNWETKEVGAHHSPFAPVGFSRPTFLWNKWDTRWKKILWPIASTYRSPAVT